VQEAIDALNPKFNSTRLRLQIHDELVWECLDEDISALSELIKIRLSSASSITGLYLPVR
jgi:DNA polymerase I-like protein with 3'-5' exonuclease and polymerase domains